MIHRLLDRKFGIPAEVQYICQEEIDADDGETLPKGSIPGWYVWVDGGTGLAGQFLTASDADLEARKHYIDDSDKSVIYKYQLEVTDTQVLKVPSNFKPLYVAIQHGSPCIWARVGKDLPEIEITVSMIGTGHEFEEDDVGEYVGACQMQEGHLVLHVFVK